MALLESFILASCVVIVGTRESFGAFLADDFVVCYVVDAPFSVAGSELSAPTRSSWLRRKCFTFSVLSVSACA